MKVEITPELKSFINKKPIKSEKAIPEFGLMLDLKSVQKKITKFVKIEKNQKTFIIELTS